MRIDEKRIQRLVEFQSDDPKVLSLYLDVDSTRRTKEEYRLTLRQMLKGEEHLADKADIQAVERYFDYEYDSSARGVALFSCQGKGLWEVFTLPVPVRDRITTARRAYITPLQDLIEDYGCYGIVLVDQERARFFLYELGDVEEVSRLIGEEIKRHKQGGWAAERYQRHVEAIAHHNFKEAIEATQAFLEKHQCRKLLLAGTSENVAVFRDMLSNPTRNLVIGEITLAMDAGEAEVRDKAFEAIEAHVRAQERALVQRLVETAAQRGPAVVGLADTLTMLQEQRAYILLVSEGYEAEGAQCTNCGYLAAQWIDRCPFCSAPMKVQEHVVNAAIHLAVDQGIQVEIINESELLDNSGRIGALLRY